LIGTAIHPEYRGRGRATFLKAFDLKMQITDAAFKQWRRVLEIAPNFLMTHFFLTDAYLKLGRGEEAIAAAQKAVDLSGRGSLFLGSLGYAYALFGKRAAALAVIDELKDKHAVGEAGGFNFAQVYTGLKDYNQAISWLERDFESGNTIMLTNVTASYFYDHLSSDSRYQNLLRRIGIPADKDTCTQREGKRQAK